MVSSPTIPPGGEGKIKVSLHTRGRKGRLAKTIQVYSNDPVHKTFALKLDGQVDVLAIFAPERLNLQRIRGGAKVEKLVRIDGKLADKVKLSDVRSSKAGVLEGKITKDDSGRPALAVTVQPAARAAGAQEERFHGTLRVKTGLAEPKEMTLFVWGVISPDVFVERSYLFFPPFNEKRPQTIQVAISALSGKRFRVRKIEDPDKHVVGKVVRDKQGGQRLALTLKSKPKLSGKLRIHLDRKDQPMIEVRYGVRQAFNFTRRPRRRRMPVHRGLIKPNRPSAPIKRPK